VRSKEQEVLPICWYFVNLIRRGVRAWDSSPKKKGGEERLASSKIKMKQTNVFLTVLLVCTGLVLHPTHAQDDIAVTSRRIMVLTANEYNASAQKDWEAIPNKADAEFLDRFIQKYPTARQGRSFFSNLNPVVFTLRYNLVQTSRSIREYNRFIETYPGTLATQLAIHEVFLLYRLEDRVSGYLDFMRRYPNTPHALVAKMRVEALMFQFATLVDRVEDYDAFIDTFPDAPQVQAAETLAITLAIKAEKNYPGSRGKRSWELLNRYYYGVLSNAEKALEEKADNVTISRFYRLANRYKEVLIGEYAATPSARKVRDDERHAQLIKQLQSVRQTLENNHKDLIETLKEEFASTHETLRKDFESLYKDNEDIKKALENLEVSMNVLHEELIAVNQYLVRIHQGITDVKLTINRTNRALTVLYNDLNHVYASLVDINRHMNAGFTIQQEAIKTVAKEVRRGLSLLHEDMQANMGLQPEIAYQNILMQNSIQNTLLTHHKENLEQGEQTATRLRNIIYASSEEQIGTRYDIAETLVAALYGSTSLIAGSIDEQTEWQIYNTDRNISGIYDSGVPVVKAANKVGERIGLLAESGNNGEGDLDGLLMNLGASFTDVFIQGPGAVIQTVAPAFLDASLTEEELDWDTLYDTGLDVMVNTATSTYPEAADAVGTLTKIARMEDEMAINEVKRKAEEHGGGSLAEYSDEVIKFMARKIR